MSDTHDHIEPGWALLGLLDDFKTWLINWLANRDPREADTLDVFDFGLLFGQLDEALHQERPDFLRIARLLADLHTLTVRNDHPNPAEVDDALAEIMTLLWVWSAGKALHQKQLSSIGRSTLASLPPFVARYSPLGWLEVQKTKHGRVRCYQPPAVRSNPLVEVSNLCDADWRKIVLRHAGK